MKNEYGDFVNFKSSMINPEMMGYNTFSKKVIGMMDKTTSWLPKIYIS